MSTHSVLLAVILTETAEVSMNFTEMTVTLQRQLAYAGSQTTPCQIEFVNSVVDAVALFKSTDRTRLVVIDGDVGVDVPFIQKIHPFPVVVASYPIRKLNWERISSYIMKQRESGKDPNPDEARSEGCIYNFAPASESCLSESYLPVTRAQAKIVSVSRDGLDLFLESYDQATKTVTSDGGIVVDLSTTVKNPGPYDFVGVVGRRLLQSANLPSPEPVQEPVQEPSPVIEETTNVDEICYM